MNTSLKYTASCAHVRHPTHTKINGEYVIGSIYWNGHLIRRYRQGRTEKIVEGCGICLARVSDNQFYDCLIQKITAPENLRNNHKI